MERQHSDTTRGVHTGGAPGPAKKNLGVSEPLRFVVFAVFVTAALAAAFYVPALRRTGPWPAPLDDVYIHFDFARSIAQGHPFEWIPGNGYSSGATSLVYPFVLAAGYL